MSTAVVESQAEPLTQAAIQPKVYRWTRDEYYKLAEAGFFIGKRVELIGGEIIRMSPMGRSHVLAVKFGAKALEKAFGKGWFVQTQAPLTLSDDSEPEPDIAVIAGNDFDYFDEHPTSAALIVEVSDSTISEDRRWKGSFYASAGISDYWIVNLQKRQLEIYRRPIPDDAAPFSFAYSEIRILNEKDKVSPLAKPRAVIKVSALLP